MTDVELVVSARNEATKSIDELVKAVRDLDKEQGAASFFRRLTETSADLEEQQEKLKNSLNEVSEAQRRFGSQSEAQQNALERQRKNVERASDTLSELNTRYKDFAEAADRTRAPSESLTNRLQNQQLTQARLAETIKQVSAEIRSAQQSLSQSGGVDSRAAGAIQKQEDQVQKLGRAWVETTRQIRQAALVQEQSASQSSSASFDRLIAKARDQKQAYQELKNSLVGFRQEQSKLGTERQVQNIQKLNSQLESLQGRYNKTSSSIAQSQEKINRASAPDPSATRRFDLLKQSIVEAEAAVKREADALDELQREFKETGAGSAEFARRQEQVSAAAERLSREQKELNDRLSQTDNAFRRGQSRAAGFGGEIRNVARESRKTGDIIGRLRSEILVFAGTAVNIFAVTRGIQSVFDTATKAQRATARLAGRFQGDFTAVNQEIAFVRAEADRLSLNFESLLDNYSSFIAGVPDGTLTLEQVRFTFSGISEAARASGLSIDQVDGVFKALTQIVSKDSLALEELRQQLGDRLPGAVAIAAQSLTDATGELVTVEELLNRINNGQVTGASVVAIAEGIRKQLGGGLEESLKSPLAALTEYQNVLTDLRLEVGRSGFLEVLTESLRRLSDEVSSEEFGEFAVSLASGIGNIIELSVLLVENFESVKAVLIAIIAVQFARFIAAGARSVVVFAENARRATVATNGLTTATSRLGIAIQRLVNTVLLLPAAFQAGFSFGTILNEQFPVVRKFGVLLVSVFQRSIVEIGLVFDKFKLVLSEGFIGGVRQLLESLATAIPNFFGQALRGATLLISSVSPKLASSINGVVDSILAKTDETADSILDGILGDDTEFEAKAKELEENAEKARQNVANIVADMYADIEKSASKVDLNPVDVEGVQSSVDKTKDIFEGLNFFRDGVNSGKSFSEGLFSELSRIEESLAEETANSLSQRLQNIESKFSDFLSNLEVFESDSESRIDEINASSVKSIREQEALRDQGRITAEAAEKRIADIRFKSEQEIVKLRESVQGLSGARQTVQSLINVRQEQERINFFSSEFADQQRVINESLGVRRGEQEKINELLELGLITSDEATKRLDASFEQYLIKTREAVGNARLIAQESGNTQLAEFTDSFSDFEGVERRRVEIERINLLESEANQILEARRQKIETLNILSQAGQISEASARSQINQLLSESNGQMTELIDNAIELAQSFDDAFGENLVNNLEAFKAGLEDTKQNIVDAEQLNQDFASGFTDAFDQFASGAKSAKDAFKDFIVDFLRNIARAIIQQTILNAISGGAAAGGGGGLGGAISARVNHTGGLVGRDGGFRIVDPSLFIGATRYHQGGVAGSLPGLKTDEVPTILQRGEGVVSKEMMSRATAGVPDVKVNNINLIDTASVVAEGLQSEPGVKQLLNVMSANRSKFAPIFGGR